MSVFDDLPDANGPSLEEYRRQLEQQHKLSPGLLSAIAHQESGGDYRAVSPKGAQGSMQFMPATAKRFGINPLDDFQAAEGAARYLAEMRDEFGSEPLALAGYNAGEGAVRKHGGMPPYAETQAYVPGVYAKLKKLAGALNPIQSAQADEAPARSVFDDLPDAAPMESGQDAVPAQAKERPRSVFDDLPDAPGAVPQAVVPAPAQERPRSVFDDAPDAQPVSPSVGLAIPPSPNTQREVAPVDLSGLSMEVKPRTLIPTDLKGGSQFGPTNPRLPLKVLDDLKTGRTDISPAELQDMALAVQLGHVQPQDAESLRKVLEMKGVKDIGQLAAEGAQARALRDSKGIPGFAATSGGRVFLDSLVSGLSSNMADTLPSREFPATRKAAEIVRGEAQAEHPVANVAGGLVGGAVNFLPFLSVARTGAEALNLPNSVKTRIAEGIVAGLGQGAVMQPEGADKMTPGENLAARGEQAAINAVLGAVGDVVLHGGGKVLAKIPASTWFDKLRGGVEVGTAGTQVPSANAVAEIVSTPDGLIIKPKTDLLNPNYGKSDVSREETVPSNQPVQIPRFPSSDETPIARAEGSGETPLGAPVGANGAANVMAKEGQAFVETGNGEVPTAAAADDWRAVLARAEEAERLARVTNDTTLQNSLLSSALSLRKQADALKEGVKPKLTRAEAFQQRLRIDPETDDLVTAVRKLGGLDVETESDWLGRFSHLQRKVPGLPGIEQKVGQGNTLDDLVEKLRQYGYVQGRDKSELEYLLGQAETGRPVWSKFKNNFDHLEESAGKFTSNDLDWRYERPGGFDPSQHDFMIETDHGDVVPTRPVTLDDLHQLDEEQRNAEEWFAKEHASVQGGGEDAGPIAQSTGLQGDAVHGLSEGLGDPVQGRAGYQSRPVEDGGLNGQVGKLDLTGFLAHDANAQALADLQRAKEIKRSGSGLVVPAGNDNGLFSEASKQQDIMDAMPSNFHEEYSNGGKEIQGQGQSPRQETLLNQADNQTIPVQVRGDARLAEIDKELQKLEDKYHKKLNQQSSGSKSAWVPPSIKSDALKSITKQMDKLEKERYRLLQEKQHETSQSKRTVDLINEPGSDFGRVAQEVETGNTGKGRDDGKQAQQEGQGTLYANPIEPAIRAIARDLGLHPVRNAIGGGLGGYWGGQESKQEPYSMAWWADVAKGGAAGMAAFKVGSMATHGLGVGLRHVGFGKANFLDRLSQKMGTYLDGLPLIGRGPVELRNFKREMRALQGLMNKQTGEVGAFLHTHFTPSERAQMADLIETRGIVPDFNLLHRQAQALDDYVSAAAERLKDLGLLHPELETGGYLHRYYEKDMDLVSMLRKPLSSRISGTYSMARGTDDTIDRQFMSPAVQAHLNEWQANQKEIIGIERQLAKGPQLDLDDRLTDLQARQKELEKVELKEYLGDQGGKVRSFFFMPDELIRFDSVNPPHLAQVDETGPGLDTRVMPVKPVGKLSATERAWTLRGANDVHAVLHRDWTPVERAKWGEIKDAGYRYVRGMQEVSHDLARAILFQRVANNKDWVTSDAVMGKALDWVEVPKGSVGKGSPLRKYGALDGQWIRPDVWNALKNTGRNPLAASRIGELYLGALNKWKLLHTADNPVTHFNNIYSNLEMMKLAGYAPGDIADGISHLHQGDKSALYREAQEAGLFGHDWTTTVESAGGQSMGLADLAEALRTQPDIEDATYITSRLMDWKSSLFESINSIKEAQGKDKAWEVLRAGIKPVAAVGRGVGKLYGVYAKPMRNLYRVEDDLFKMAVYSAERAKGMTKEQAVIHAERFFFDYEDLPDAVKFVRDFPIGSPFISYTYLAAGAMVRNAIERPERIIAMLAAYEAANYVFTTAGKHIGPSEYWDLEDAHDTLAPGWEKGRSLLGFRNNLKVPATESYNLSLARAHVLGNPFGGESGGRKFLPELPGLGELWGSSFLGGSPLHSLVDIAVNEDWKGKPIYNPKDPDAERYRKSLAYLFQAWGPSTPVVPGSYSNTKIMEGVANQASEDRTMGKQTLPIVITDTANQIMEALGGGQFTGKDRLDNPISTRDAMLASVGIKLRPALPEQWYKMERWNMGKDKAAIDRRARDAVRNHHEERITDAQNADALLLRKEQIGELKAKHEKQTHALEMLKKLYGKK